MKEEDIRPQKIFDEYLWLARQDTINFFSDAKRVKGRCPACNEVGEFSFEKFGFEYEVCPSCHTLFVNPRPIAGAFTKYYTESLSSKFWATTFYKETAAARREKLWKPKARLVLDAMACYSATGYTIIDIGGGYGLFAEEMRDLSGRPITVIEPGSHLAGVCREKSLAVIEKFLECVDVADLPDGPRVFVSFELFEHLHDPSAFLKHLKGLMDSGDLFLFTTLSGSGVDIQVLWENSKSVSPPHHLNFFNPSSIRALIERTGLEMLDVTTPGKLDIDILVNSQVHIKDRFWRTFIATATDDAKEKWQELIAASGWSSHMMVICRKP
ncbi:MAG: class I SAM-dependent methyltransferase [Gammaproteobacteria bacterium]|nr:class I SAM-dependent methyltransferase [Gammaproteobacteria bacterium]